MSAILEMGLMSLRLRPDITITHNFTPIVGRSAVLVNDFLFLTNPEWFTLKERAYFALMPATIRWADVVLTSTANEAERIVRTSAASSVVPIGLGLNRALENAAATRPVGLGEVDGFLLTVGRLNARKNLAMTLRAAARSGVLSPRFPLLVVGEASGRSAELPDEIRGALDDGSIRLLGRMSDDELRWLYENADVFLFLTLDEGFGMPILEALASRTPMLVSDIPVFRELLGERGRRVDPRDFDAIVAAIREVVRDPQGPIDPTPLLDYYTWENAARRMRAAVMEVVR
ncbi:glycosyltransferase family 4 protein [Microbacteriaceae bacterium VKM Ac-2855]|nr:glycosyltransferase family 4 protein [Microbacteriaceae bacterium VKM Ac-2855]